MERLTVWQPDGSECPVSRLAGGKGAMVTYREDGSIEEVALIEEGKLRNLGRSADFALRSLMPSGFDRVLAGGRTRI